MASSADSTNKTSSSSSSMEENKAQPQASGQDATPKKSLFKRFTARVLCGSSNDAASVKGAEAEAESPDGKKEEQDSKDKAKDEDKDKPEDQTMKSEFKHLDRKYDEEEKPYFVERKKEDLDKADKKNWWELFAFCVVRRYDTDGDHTETCLHVNPQPLRQLLKDVIGNYPLDPIDVDDVQIRSPYHSLFHFRKPLEEVGRARFKENGDTTSAEQLELLIDWIKTNFELEIAAHERCLLSDSKAIAYNHLWTLFAPNTLVYVRTQNQPRAFLIQSYRYEENEEYDPGFYMHTRFVDYDGDQFGYRFAELTIPRFTGVREVSSHDVRPLDLVDDVEEVRAELRTRGQKFKELAAGQHFMQYKGIGMKRDPECPKKYLRFDASGRVMVDCKTYHRIDANDTIWITAFGKDHDGGSDMNDDQDLLLANANVRGYSLSAKKFLELQVDELSPIQWNKQCFEDLVLDQGTKKTVQALVSTHSKRKAAALEPDASTSALGDEFDDIVKGKGQGLVCVLHGPPGVGKTLTAECVAEYVQRPLFMVSSGDLGTNSAQLDQQLTKIMDMTSTWRAVLLIDEADVFLEQRALHDMHRNAMVSVFLRVLEYYSGILFLTTNRVATFDDAFKSRIHIPIRYTELDATSRIQIWRHFCSRVPGGSNITDKEYTKLADHELNGRQIKNVVKAAESLAAFDGVQLDYKQLQVVTKIQAKFERDLESFGDIDYTAPGAARKGAESRNMYT